MVRIERPANFEEFNNLLLAQPLENENVIGNIGRFIANKRGRILCAAGAAALYSLASSVIDSPTGENVFVAAVSVPIGTLYLAMAANENLYQIVRNQMVRDVNRLVGLFPNLGGNVNERNENREDLRDVVLPASLQEIDNQVTYRLRTNENQRDISTAAILRVPDVFESSFSTYRLAVEHFVANIPDNSTADEILTRINSYYNLASNEMDVRDFQSSLVSEFEASRRANTQAYYIDDSALSKAVFASLVGSCICHGGRLPQDNDGDVGNLIAKVATINQEQKDLLKAGVNEYLENEYTQNQDSNKKLFLLAGYKMLNSAQYINELGEETFKVIVSPRVELQATPEQQIGGVDVPEVKDSQYSELNQLEEGDIKPSGTIKTVTSSAYNNNSRGGGASL